MSREDLGAERCRVVERIYAAAATPLAFEVYDPDIVWDMSHYAGWTEQPVYRGHEGVRTMMRGWIATFERWEPTVERTVCAGDEVVAIVTDRAYLEDSSVPMVRRYAHIYVFRGRTIIRSTFYSDVSEALEAAGLSE